ncbi:MAG: hypothetical protein ACK4TG_09170 [Thermaurantiacus sp.]
MHMLTLAPIALVLMTATGAAAQQAPKTFGDSVRHNIAVQAGDMNPQYVGPEIEGGSGQRNADAVTRYQEGRVIQPRGLTASGAQIEQGGGGGAARSRPGPQ